jgi:hypothetical protein
MLYSKDNEKGKKDKIKIQKNILLSYLILNNIFQ